MTVDNRTLLNGCDANTGWAGDDTANAIATAGSFIQGTGALSTQLSNADEHMYTTQDSVGAGTFSIDMSDMTVYMNIKDNLFGAYSTGGVQFVLGDGTDRTGYDVAGNDAVGMIGQFYFTAYKMDVSEVITTPGGFTNFAGTEANLNHAAITQIGYGSLHLAKAVGSVDNVIMDGFYYIANGTAAVTIDGGTVGTPETLADTVGDDESVGANIITNPIGSQYVFFGPFEWGTPSGTLSSYFTSDGEQWFWVGDNSGGRALAAGNFPFRLIGNATGTNSWVVSNTVIVNTGTRATFDMSDANMDIIEMDACSLTGLGAIELPSSGGTSRFTTNTIFSGCDAITHNGADSSGSSVLLSNVAADASALIYNETVDPDGEMDNMVFSKGTNDHHAIEFGASIPANITLRGCSFTGFSASQDVNSSIFEFLDTSGTITINLVGCTSDVAFATSYRKPVGLTVVVVEDPVTTTINVNDNTGVALDNARVLVRAASGGPRPHDFTVTITRVTTTATVAHTAHGYGVNDKVQIKGITDKIEDNIVQTITAVTTNTYDYTTTNSGSTNYTGTILETAVFIDGLTSSGTISDTRTFASAQPVDGFVRKGTASPYFKTFDLAGNSISSTTGLEVNIRMQLDE